MKKVAEENPNANFLVRAIKFSNGAQWHVVQPTPIADFKWIDVSAADIGDMGLARDMGMALFMVAKQLSIPPMPNLALPPVLVLISDGRPTDDFFSGLEELLHQPWGERAVRIAIPIGANADLEALQKFIGHPEMRPLQANNAEDFVKYIKWVPQIVSENRIGVGLIRRCLVEGLTFQ